MRATIRLRLAFVHTMIFMVMAILLVCGIYVLTARSTALQSADPWTGVERKLGLPPGSLVQNRSMPYHPRRTPSRALPRRPGRPDSGTLRKDLHEPIALQGPHDELRELADTFDEMLARLDRAFKGQQLFAANAAHELRTPLTRIRARLEVTLAKPHVTRADLERMATTIRDAVDRSAALIDSLLLLARTQGRTERRPVAIDEVARSALDDLRHAVTRRGISLTMRLTPCTVTGDPVLLEHLVRNLVDNAITHNVEGGWVNVETQTNGMARLRVSNSGVVVPPTSVEDLFIRMHTPDGGFGLGLAIVKAVAEAHHGRVCAEAFDEGGLAIEFTLPSADPAVPHLSWLAGLPPAALGALIAPLRGVCAAVDTVRSCGQSLFRNPMLRGPRGRRGHPGAESGRIIAAGHTRRLLRAAAAAGAAPPARCGWSRWPSLPLRSLPLARHPRHPSPVRDRRR